MATINIRTDEKLKKDAGKIFRELGLDMSGAVKLFLSQVVITKTVPFKLRTVNGMTYEDEQEILETSAQLRKDLKAGKIKAFGTAEKLTKDILK